MRPSIFIFATALTVSSTAYSADKATQQVPGFYHYNLGEFQVTALYDGYLNISPQFFQGMPEKDMRAILDKRLVNTDDGIQTAVNTYLLNRGDKLILIDSGAGQCNGENAGKLQENITAAGYSAEAIDAVLLTHMHPDHVCGISADAKTKSFPNATIYVNKVEADHWLDMSKVDALPKDYQARAKATFEKIAAVVKPYQNDNQFNTYTIGETIIEGIDGIEAIATYGHTIGHTSYMLSSNQQKMLISGDFVHNYTLQFPHPIVTIQFDSDPAQAAKTRQAQFTKAAEEKYLIAGAHIPFPGIGYVIDANEGQFIWSPIEYSPLK